MKAEHRKELETNILADRMGRVLRGSHETQMQTVWYWVIGIVVVFIVFFLGYRWYVTRQESAAEAWVALESGDEQGLDVLARKYASQNVGKAARMQLAFERLWARGIRQLGANTVEAKNNISIAREDYEKLAVDCKSDPVFLGEALYGLAVVEETEAISDPDKLKSAVTAYRRVVKEAKDTAFAKLAQDRADLLEVPAAVDGEDAKAREEREARLKKLDEIQRIYRYLHGDLGKRFGGGLPGDPFMGDADQQRRLEDLFRQNPGLREKLKAMESKSLETKPVDPKSLPKIEGPEVKAPDGKPPETKTPDGKSTDKKDDKTPATKGPDGKEKLPDIAPPPTNPVPPPPGVQAPGPKAPTTPPDAKTDDKKQK